METYAQAMARNAGLKEDAHKRLIINAKMRKHSAKKPPALVHNRKAARALSRRMADYAVMMGTKNTEASGAQQRKDSGGYHRPGSYSK